MKMKARICSMQFTADKLLDADFDAEPLVRMTVQPHARHAKAAEEITDDGTHWRSIASPRFDPTEMRR